MTRSLLCISLIIASFSSFAQDVTKDEAAKLQLESDKLKGIAADTIKNWKFGGVISFNGQQVALSNWAAGGTNSISFGGIFSVYARYKKGKTTWDNSVDLGYGVIKQGGNKDYWKTDDKIQLTSKYGRQAFKKWYYTALGDFKTQFTDGYNYPNDSMYISRFMAPAYGIAAIGLDYKPNDKFSLFIAPVTCKFTFVNDDSLARYGAYGVQKEIRDPYNGGAIVQNYKTHREEFGAYLKLQYQNKVMDNVTFQTMLELFSNYLNHPENIDVNWTTLTTLKVNRFISATLTTQLIYDHDIMLLRNTGDKKGTTGPDVQFKQVLGVGFTYKFQ
ncbi:MAG: DUF3078 domain-containing protein [Bacteroidota bacterium]